MTLALNGQTKRDALAPEWLASCLTDRILHLILLPTEACNFRCVYCYEDFRYRRMEPWVVQGVKNLLTHRAEGLASLGLSWFGGEPLLARDIMEDIMLHAAGLRAVNPSLEIHSSATTNGYLLTRPVFERLLALGVTSYQISFDGPPEWHDRKRVTAGGKGTFQRIWDNLTSLRDVAGEFTITIRVHVDEENAGAIPEFLDRYAETFAASPRFPIFIRGLSRLGGPNDASLRVFQRDEGNRVCERLRGVARSRGLPLMDPGEEGVVCYAAKGNSFVIRSNGRINKCTVALEHPNNQVGRIHEDGTVEIIAPKARMWMRGLESGSPDELRCPMRGYADLPLTPEGAGRKLLPLGPAARPVSGCEKVSRTE